MHLRVSSKVKTTIDNVQSNSANVKLSTCAKPDDPAFRVLTFDNVKQPDFAKDDHVAWTRNWHVMLASFHDSVHRWSDAAKIQLDEWSFRLPCNNRPSYAKRSRPTSDEVPIGPRFMVAYETTPRHERISNEHTIDDRMHATHFVTSVQFRIINKMSSSDFKIPETGSEWVVPVTKLGVLDKAVNSSTQVIWIQS